MNTSHFPKLELCKKLTEIGFPNTLVHIGENESSVMGCSETPESFAVCPSVMELLDVMPQQVHWKDKNLISTLIIEGWMQGSGPYLVGYHHEPRFKGTLPNALAEMVLWLHENGYISFTK